MITDRYSKLTSATPTFKTISAQMANLFLDHCIVSFDIPSYLLTNNGTLLVNKFLSCISGYPGLKQLTTIGCNSWKNGQAELYNRTIFTRPQRYISDHQRNWDLLVQPLTYTYNTQVHKSSNTSPYRLVLSRHPSGPSLLTTTTSAPKVDMNETSSQAIRNLIEKRILKLYAKKVFHVRKSRARKKADYDTRVREMPTYILGCYVFTDNPPIHANRRTKDVVASKAYNKLQPRAAGQFKILQKHDKTIYIKDSRIPEIVFVDPVAHTLTSSLTAPTLSRSKRCAKHNPSPQTSNKIVLAVQNTTLNILFDK